MKNLFAFFFKFGSYKRGLIIHLSLLFVYSAVFIAGYYFCNSYAQNETYRIYYQYSISKLLVICMLGHLLLLIVLRWKQFVILMATYFSEKGSAYNLAVFRIVFFSTLTHYFLRYAPDTLMAWTYLPDSQRFDLPFMGWLIQNLPVSPSLYYICCIVGGVLSFMIFIGLFTRQALLLLLPFALYVVGVPMFYGKINHDHILVWIPLIFCFSPVSDVWSVDAFIKKRRSGLSEKINYHAKYALPFRILWIQLSIIYCFAGLVKLWDAGLDWALSDSMINQMRWEWVEHYDKTPAFRLDNYPVLAKAGGLLIIYFELLYFLLILKPAGRIWAFVGAYSMHRIAGYFMYIDFFHLRISHYTYINWHKLVRFFKLKFVPETETEQTIATNGFRELLKKEKLRRTFIIGISLIFMNFIFSSRKIHSFPFSSYPTYSGLAKDEIQVIRMDAATADGKKVDVKATGEKVNFRWETFRPFEQRISEIAERKDSFLLKQKLKEYWTLWRNNVKGLEEVAEINMYMETTSIVPEERKKVLKTEYLGKVIIPN